MSDDTLRLILRRLEGIDHRLEGIDHRFDGIDHRLDGTDHRLDGIDHRLDGVGHRFDNVEREQTRVRTDLLGEMERVLTEVQTFKDDMTVAMNYAARADVTSATAASAQRAMQSELARLRVRVDRLEGKRGEAG